MTELTRAIKPLANRLEAHSTPVPFCGCKLWFGASVPRGYGIVYDTSHGRRQEYAYRSAWEIANGPIPDGLFVLHECDMPECINPDHLFLGTLSDNTQDMLTKGRCRAGCPKGRAPALLYPGLFAGERNGQAKLTMAQARQIREMYKPGVRQVDIARLFGIKQAQVSSIVRGESWVE